MSKDQVTKNNMIDAVIKIDASTVIGWLAEILENEATIYKGDCDETASAYEKIAQELRCVEGNALTEGI